MDLDALRHSTSHVMAQAVKELWPDTKLGIGPSIEDGFYYDFDREEPFAPEDLEAIEAKMRATAGFMSGSRNGSLRSASLGLRKRAADSGVRWPRLMST